MTRGKTSDEQARLDQDSQVEITLLELDMISGTERYCSGDIPYYYDGNWYEPRDFTVPDSVSLGAPSDQNGLFRVFNGDSELTDYFYDKEFGKGSYLTLIEIIWSYEDGDFAKADGQSWKIKDAKIKMFGDQQYMHITCSGNTGWKPGLALRVGSAKCDLCFKDGVWCDSASGNHTCPRTFADCTKQDDFVGFQYFMKPGTVIEVGDNAFIVQDSWYNPYQGVDDEPETGGLRRTSGRTRGTKIESKPRKPTGRRRAT